MRRLFADAFYWIALFNDRDQDHQAVEAFSQALTTETLVTTEEVLTEVLNYFCEHGPQMRRTIAAFVRSIRSDPTIEVRPQSSQSFLAGLALSDARPDKQYSLTDCIAMDAMRQAGLTEVLTGDSHFSQEGLVILFQRRS